MKLRRILPVASIVVTFTGAASAKDFSATDVETADPAAELRAICGDGKPGMPKPGTGPARFTIEANGSLKLASRKAGGASFGFPQASPAAIVKIENITDRTRPGTVVACGPVGSGKTYTLDDTREGSVLRVQLFDSKGADESLLDDARKAVLATAEQRERTAVHRISGLRELFAAARAALATPNDASLAAVDAAANTTQLTLTAAAGRFQCSAANNDEPLAPAVCDEVASVAIPVASVAAIAKRVKSTAESGRVAQLQSEKFLEQVKALQPAEPWSADDEAAQCNQIGKLRWLHTAGARRLIARAEVPIVPPDTLLEMTYGEPGTDRTGVSPSAIYGVALHGVGRGEKVKFAVNVGKSIASELPTVLATFVPYLMKALPAPLGALDLTGPCMLDEKACVLLKQQQASAELGIESLICVHKGSEKGKDATRSLVVDASVPPVSKTETRAYVFGPIKSANVSNVAACAGETCTGADDDKAVKSRVALTPTRAGTFTMLAELSFGMGLVNTRGDGPGFDIMNTANWETTAEGVGPDQLYALRRRLDPRNAFATSVLLGLRVSDRCIAAIGPALLIGTSGGTFTQWNARVGWSFTKGLYLLIGPSFRLLQEPENFRVGDRAPVQKGANGAATPPPLVSHYGGELQFDVGLGFDLAALGSAVSDTLKGFGGK